ncbi:CheR family methyltransferase [Candidatus Berkiella aquae]|uniref:Chemotaxis protein methyltransferase n=1 Tax=Candidatus Berkiella aquae TaxID=295108 RepID=A0A0Q9Z023_9GAMM|nr:protein-glutamate O-methyltransferase CheR [Candidatus Berkiella aquae]MCS5712007.1 protein-glutamate O-methyltransferase CheR [Candidatus Berkiella aquae]
MNLNENEFQFSDKNFQYLKQKVFQLTGINLSDSKTALVYSRISRLLRQNHFNDFDEYCNYLEQHEPKAEREFINAITTNFTSFMREEHHFEYLQEVLLPEIIERNRLKKRIRIWSAGCSTGEEPYSISFVVNDVLKDIQDWDVKILATDIDSDALLTAENGLYKDKDVEQISASYLKRKARYFDLYDSQTKTYSINNQFRKIIYFKYFNLMCKEGWPMQGPFDIIFCRNVMIYFDRFSQNQIINTFCNLLAVKGYLILGHSESVPSSIQNKLKYVDRTIYQRVQ